MPTSAIYNVYRAKNARLLTPQDFLPPEAPSPKAEPPRWAKPGERPPSRRPADQPDDIIDRLDAYAARLKQRNGRNG